MTSTATVADKVQSFHVALLTSFVLAEDAVDGADGALLSFLINVWARLMGLRSEQVMADIVIRRTR